MSEPVIESAIDEAVEELNAHLASQGDPRKLSVETLSVVIATQGVRKLEERIRNEFMELRERQAKVQLLHKLQKHINAISDDEGGFDCSNDPELQELIQQAEEMGVPIPGKKDGENKLSFTPEEKRAYMENIKMTVDDLQLLNDLQLQKISNLTNRRYEYYQMARSILRPLHEDKINKARKIAGG